LLQQARLRNESVKCALVVPPTHCVVNRITTTRSVNFLLYFVVLILRTVSDNRHMFSRCCCLSSNYVPSCNTRLLLFLSQYYREACNYVNPHNSGKPLAPVRITARGQTVLQVHAVAVRHRCRSHSVTQPLETYRSHVLVFWMRCITSVDTLSSRFWNISQYCASPSS